MKNTAFVIVILSLFLGLSNCSDKDPVAINWGYNYFPLEEGHWIIYDVDSTIYDDFSGTVTTVSYQIKEQVDSSFTDNEGREAFGIKRYRRNTDSLSWKLKDIWYAVKTDRKAEKVEENLRFLKLVFPVRNNKTWNGNIFISGNSGTGDVCDPVDYDDWKYEYKNVDVPATFNTLQFDSTLTVEQINDTTDNLLTMTFGYEKYAKGVGMVQKEFWHLSTCGEIRFGAWEEKASGGFIVKMTISDYKK